jgi:hypothetical protein
MGTNSIQNVKLDIINRISTTNDKSMLQKVWDMISSSEINNTSKRVFTKEEKQIFNSIENGIKEVQLIEKGKLKAKPINDFLNEL